MDAVTQAHAIDDTPLGGGEAARFFAAPRFEGLDCLTATFRTHRYAPHRHETYAIGCIVEGCETFQVRGVKCYAQSGDVAAVNPQEVHDGEPQGAGYSYRMAYPTVALMRRIAGEVSGRADAGVPWFPQTIQRDAQGFALFTAAHRALEQGCDALAGEEMLYRAFAHCIARHARIAPAATGAERDAVARVKAMLNDRYGEELSLGALAAEARLSPYQLIRAFRRDAGMTPHAFLVDRRVQVARQRLRRNERVADVALATGFADQAHLTRVFKARVGATPGAYRAAIAQ